MRQRIEGMAALQKRLAKLEPKVRRKFELKALRPAARILRDKAKALAPQGPTGNLKKSMEVKTLRGMPPAVAVRPKYERAPHQHLIEFGTAERFRSSIGGQFAYLEPGANATQRRTGAVKPNSYMWAAWNATRNAVQQRIVVEAGKLVESEAIR